MRTTFIVGFPGEGEEEFAELQRFVDEVGFDHVGVFAYSWQRENPGAELGDPVPQRVKEKRLRALMRQQERISRERHRALKGARVTALVEGASAGVRAAAAGQAGGAGARGGRPRAVLRRYARKPAIW